MKMPEGAPAASPHADPGQGVRIAPGRDWPARPRGPIRGPAPERPGGGVRAPAQTLCKRTRPRCAAPGARARPPPPGCTPRGGVPRRARRRRGRTPPPPSAPLFLSCRCVARCMSCLERELSLPVWLGGSRYWSMPTRAGAGDGRAGRPCASREQPTRRGDAARTSVHVTHAQREGAAKDAVALSHNSPTGTS